MVDLQKTGVLRALFHQEEAAAPESAAAAAAGTTPAQQADDTSGSSGLQSRTEAAAEHAMAADDRSGADYSAAQPNGDRHLTASRSECKSSCQRQGCKSHSMLHI